MYMPKSEIYHPIIKPRRHLILRDGRLLAKTVEGIKPDKRNHEQSLKEGIAVKIMLANKA